MTIPSPVAVGKTKLIREIDSKKIIALYKNFDASAYFRGAERIQVLECVDTGYRFYYPFSVAGDGGYYDRLAQDVRYYMPAKWEYERVLQEVEQGDSILEIGCGNGDFLAQAKQKGGRCTGFDLNSAAVAICQQKGLDVKESSFDDFVKGEKRKFDIICSFQVLEHISDIRGYMLASCKLLAPDGKLIIAVPNNDSFIKKDPFNARNMPPHHMGLWNEGAFRKLPAYFDLSLYAIAKESLQRYHFRYFYNLHMGNAIARGGLAGRVANKLLYPLIFLPLLTIFPWAITGHTIIAIYQTKTAKN